MEACGYEFLQAQYLKEEVDCVVYVLNPGKELSLVSLPTEREEEARQLISMKRFLVKTRTALINRLRTLYEAAGEKGLKEKDLMTAGKCAKLKPLLPGGIPRMIAETIERELEVVEEELAVYREKLAGIVREREVAPYIMSIPRVGSSLAAAFIAYVGDGNRFSKAGESANYAGLTPVLDCSGDMERYGHIQRGGWYV